MERILKVFGNRLKTLRKEHKLTQQELAQKLGIHASYIGLTERSERIPQLVTLDKIAKFFEVEPSYLVMEEKKPQKFNQKQQELLEIVREGPPERINNLHKVARMVMETSGRKGK